MFNFLKNILKLRRFVVTYHVKGYEHLKDLHIGTFKSKRQALEKVQAYAKENQHYKIYLTEYIGTKEISKIPFNIDC